MKKCILFTLSTLLIIPGHARTVERSDFSFEQINILLSLNNKLIDLNGHIDSLSERTRLLESIRSLKDQLRSVRKSVRRGAPLPSEAELDTWKQKFFEARHGVCTQVEKELQKKKKLRSSYISSQKKSHLDDLMVRYHRKCSIEGESLAEAPLAQSAPHLSENMFELKRLAQKINRQF